MKKYPDLTRKEIKTMQNQLKKDLYEVVKKYKKQFRCVRFLLYGPGAKSADSMILDYPCAGYWLDYPKDKSLTVLEIKKQAHMIQKDLGCVMKNFEDETGIYISDAGTSLLGFGVWCEFYFPQL